MLSEFIPYEQALALKELGFDEECLAYYNGDKELDHLMPERVIYSANYNNSTNIVSAPLYQQAFKWFREKYKILVIPQDVSYTDGDCEYFFDIKCLDDSIIIEDGIPDYFPNYEDAELDCLRKVIKIVKDGLPNS